MTDILFNRTFDVLGPNAKFDLTKTFRNQLFLRVRVLYHQYLIKNHSESILKSKTISILMIIFVDVFFYLIS